MEAFDWKPEMLKWNSAPHKNLLSKLLYERNGELRLSSHYPCSESTATSVVLEEGYLSSLGYFSSN